MGKVSKIIVITLLILLCCIFFTNVYAFTPEDYDPSGSLKKEDWDDFAGRAGTIVKTIRNLGAIVSVLGIAVLGLRYMFGSLDQKANYKETLLPFCIGIAITVGITTIITIVQEIAENL